MLNCLFVIELCNVQTKENVKNKARKQAKEIWICITNVRGTRRSCDIRYFVLQYTPSNGWSAPCPNVPEPNQTLQESKSIDLPEAITT